jgi:hypothetical protein
MKLTYAMYGLMAVVCWTTYIDGYGWAHTVTGIIALILCNMVIHLVGKQANGDTQLKEEFGIVRDSVGFKEYIRIEDLRALLEAERKARETD